MRLEDFKNVVVNNFRGLFIRGDEENCPSDHFTDCLNVRFEHDNCLTREGTYLSHASLGGIGVIKRWFNYLEPSTLDQCMLILTTGGAIKKLKVGSLSAAIITNANATDFSAIMLNERIYIALHDGQKGLNGVNLQVYDPVGGSIRDAAGLAPSAAGAMGAANGAASVLVNAGVYKIAVAYITDSGFITVPGPEVASVFTPTSYTSPGALKISMTVIPTGPTGTAKRQLLITKANEEEYFFLPSDFGGLIVDNTTTTATLDFDDTTDLVESADYLFDQLETIPSPLGLKIYSGRLITLGEANGAVKYTSYLRVSYPGEYESFDSVDGVVPIKKDSGLWLTNGETIRNTFYAHKNLGVFGVIDNGEVPAEWIITAIDESINTPPHGISSFSKLGDVNMGRSFYLVVDRSGILLMNGIFQKPPITYKINDLWQRINWARYHQCVLVIDEQFHRIYFSCPIDSSVDNNLFLYGDYSQCPGGIPDADNVRWAIWEFHPDGATATTADAIGLGLLGDVLPFLKIGSKNGDSLWTLSALPSLDPGATDEGATFANFIETARFQWSSGFFNFFNVFRTDISGSGNLAVTGKGKDDLLSKTFYAALALSAAPGVETIREIDFLNESLKIKFSLTSGKFTLQKLEIFGVPMYPASR